MKASFLKWLLLAAFAICPAAACSEDKKEEFKEAQPCNPALPKQCKSGRYCEQVVGGEPTCFDAIVVQGKVFDTVSTAPIKGAQIVARDPNGAAVSGIAVSNDRGEYSLPVPVQRNPDGTPVAPLPTYSLRADASGYQTFPYPPRVALPIPIVAPATKTAATDIGLVPLTDTATLGTISGKVVADQPGGTLVVATGGSTAIADIKGGFTIYNVPAGTVEVRGYLKGVNLETKSVELAAGQVVKDVVLNKVADATAKVSGTITFVDPGSGITSVILVVKETFNESAARGETPPGFEAENVAGPFYIAGVPDGNYVVLAAFENDQPVGLVRDESGIGGTSIVSITVAGADLALSDTFKVTGALDVVSPTDNAEVSGTPTFVWADDSSEKRYSIQVFDALGNLTWDKQDRDAVTGSTTVSQTYEGPPLVSGMIYQFKAKSWDALSGGNMLSGTEDLKGVFTYK